MSSLPEYAVIVERAQGHRLVAAERLVLAWPDLFSGQLRACDVGVRPEPRLFLAVARFAPHVALAEVEARFAFWAEQSGAVWLALGDLDKRERANLLSRLEACSQRALDVPPDELPGRISDLMGALGVAHEQRAATRVRAELPLVLRHESDAVTYDVSTRGLFVRSSRLPPLGDRMGLQLELPGSPTPFEAEGRVVHVHFGDARRPSGFGLSLLSPAPELLGALADYVSAARARRIPSVRPEERRVEVRSPVHAPVQVRSGPVVLTAYAAGGPPGADVVENLSLGGALVRTDTSLPVDTEVRLDVQLPEGGALPLSGVVVRSEPGAVGVRFTLDDTTRGALMQVLLGLGRAAQEKRPPLQVRYDTPTAVAADRRTLLLGGVFVRGARPMPLQSTVTVEVELPEAQRFKCTGEVVSIEAQGVGVELQLEEGERTRFQRAVEAQARRASAPPPPTREAEVAPLLDELTPMPRKAPEEPERPRVGNYELLSLLGRGGMAEVYYARAVAGPHAGQCVAIKRLLPALASDPTAVELFIGEADLSRLLVHPTVVRTLDVGTYGGGYYLVMEHVDGRDLGQVLRRCQQRGLQVPVDFAVYIVRTLLEALAYAHEARGLSGRVLGVVHRDVSPSNVFISRLGEVKLGDFGVARVRGMAADGPMAGKLAFLSPEALEGEVSPAVDVWAANVVLYEMLTLRRPFGGETPEETAEAVRACRYTPVRQLRPEVPPQLAALVDRAFAPKASARLTSAAEYAEALQPLSDERVGNPMAIAALVRGLFDTPTRQ